MARVEISSMPWGTLWDRHGEGQNGTTATLKNLDGTNATTWSAITGGTSSTASLTADASGNLPRFVEGGQYTLDVPALSITGRRVEAVSGSVESRSVSIDAYVTLAATVADGIEAAISAATAANTRIGYLTANPGSTFLLNRPVKVPRDLLGLTIDGQWATIKLAVAAPQAFIWDRTLSGQTFQNVTWRNWTCDGNNVGGIGHVFIGPDRPDGLGTANISLDEIHVDGLVLNNVPVGTDPLVTFRIGVMIGCVNPIASPQATFTNCSVRNVKSDGCLQLVNAAQPVAAAETTSSGYHDNILIEDIEHYLPTTPTAFNNAAHVMAGTKGQGGTITIRRVRGTNSADVGVECDGYQTAVLDDIAVEDSFSCGFLHVNFKLPEYPESQTITYTKCTSTARDLINRGWVIGGLGSLTVANNNKPGRVHFGDGCEHRRFSSAPWADLSSTVGSVTYWAEAAWIIGSRAVTGHLHSVIEGPTYAGSTDLNVSGVVIHADATGRTAVELGLRCLLSSARSSTGKINWKAVELVKGNLTGFELDVESDYTVTTDTDSTVIHAQIGGPTSTSTTLSGRIRMRVPDRSTLNATAASCGIQFGSGSFNTVPTNAEVLVHGCDHAGLNVSNNDVLFQGGTTLANKVRFQLNRWRAFPQARRAIAVTTTINTLADLIAVTSTAAARTVNLPAVAAIPVGKVITVVDESNAASVNNITIDPSGAETFTDAAATKAISTNGGKLAFYSNGTNWVVA